MKKVVSKKSSVKKTASKKSVSTVPKEKSIAILAHILGLVTGFIGPLIIYLVSDDDKWTKENARMALNWQLSFMIYTSLSILFLLILIGFLLIPVLLVLDVVYSVIATVKSGEGKLWRYPLAIPFIQ